MTAIALTTAAVAAHDPLHYATHIETVLLAEAVTIGQAAYETTSGTYGIADANASGKQQFRGIFLETGAAGQAVSLLIRGFVSGFTISGMTYEDLVYLSDTAGSLDTAAGTMTVRCGRIRALPVRSASSSAVTHGLWIDATPGLITAWS